MRKRCDGDGETGLAHIKSVSNFKLNENALVTLSRACVAVSRAGRYRHGRAARAALWRWRYCIQIWPIVVRSNNRSSVSRLSSL